MTPTSRSFFAVSLALAAPAALAQGLTPEQMMRLRAVIGVYPSPDGGRVAFTRTEPRPISDGPGTSYAHLFLLEDGGERLLLGGQRGVGGVSWDPREERICFVHKGEDDPHPEVWAIGLDGDEPVRVTRTPHGVSSYAWQPDGAQIAFTVLDPAPEARAAARERGFRQEVVDEDYSHRSLWLWDRGDGSTRQLTRERTVFDFEWSPDGSVIAAAIAPRNLVDDSYMFKRLHQIDPATGASALLVDNPGKLGGFRWNADASELAYISAADRNDPHAGTLFVVERRSGAVRCLTRALRGMVHDVHWSTHAGSPALSVVLSRGVQTNLALLEPRSGEILDERSPAPEGPAFQAVAGAWDGPHGRYFVGSTAGHPPELYGAGNGLPFYAPLTDSNPWLADVALGEQEIVRYRARDGLEIEGLLIHPLEHREGTRRPLVIVAHGGPESHYSNGWLTSYGSWGQMLAARNYYAWYPNYRASTGYGVAFAKADHGDPMGAEFRDHLDAIAYFDERGLIDPDRVAIGGGSYGGYTAAWAATRHSEHFAAAVSFVPFVDIRTKWLTSDIPYEFFYVHYQEAWPHEQRGFLSDRSPLTYAARCRTPLLLLGGTADPRVHPSQPFMLYRAVKFATDTPTRYVQYPGEGHGNRTNVYRYDYAVRTLRWLDHYLRPGARRTDAPPPFDFDYSAVLGGEER